MTRDTIGKWILPQPKDAKDTGEYVSIPRLTKLQIPFGYKVSEHDEMMLDPIPFELESLEQAKDYLKRYGSRHVAAWLTKTTGRYISHAGLLKRVKDEQRYTSKVATLRKWAARYRKAVEEAERYENRRGTKVAKQARDILDAVDARHAKPE
jgi:hypothetical protein